MKWVGSGHKTTVNQAVCQPMTNLIASLQVLAIEFVAFAIEFVPLANEFVTLAIEFVHLAIEFITLAQKFVMTE